MIQLPPTVHPGDRFTPALWNKMVAAIRALTPQAGQGARISRMPGGFTVSFDAPPLSWDHPFRCMMTGNAVTVSVGLVNGVEPTIGGVPVSGVDAKGNPVSGGVPKLTIGSEHDSEGRNWIVVRVTTDASGKILKAEIATTTTWPQDLGPLVSQHPLAVVKTISGSQTIWQQTFHNLGHQWLKPSVGTGRHFYWAV